MKQFKLTVGVFLIGTVSLIGCNKQSEIKTSTAVQALDKNAESAKMIDYMVTQWGYKKEDIKEMSNQFVIQGDMAIPKKDFWTEYARTNDLASRHYQTPNLVTALNVIYVGIDPSVPTEWKTAYIDAMSKWNALNGRISFSNCSCTPANGIWVSYQSFGTGDRKNDFAYTLLPSSSGYAGTNSYINSTCPVSTSASEKLGIAVHELGHSIGFGHTDHFWEATNRITVNPSCDDFHPLSYSVMHQGGAAFSDFSDCDKAAFKTIYPK